MEMIAYAPVSCCGFQQSAGGSQSQEADRVGAWLGLILNIKLSLIHTFFAYFKQPDPY